MPNTIVDDSYISTSITPDATEDTPTATPKATATARLLYSCATYARNNKRIARRSGHTPIVQHTQTPTPATTPIVSQTPDATPSTTSSQAIATGTATAISTSTAAATAEATATAIATATITATVDATATGNNPAYAIDESSIDISVPVIGKINSEPAVNIQNDGWNLLNSQPTSTQTPLANRASSKATNLRYRQKGRWGNCLRNSIDATDTIDVMGTLTHNIGIIAGGALAGTALFYGIAYLISRRRHA